MPFCGMRLIIDVWKTENEMGQPSVEEIAENTHLFRRYNVELHDTFERLKNRNMRRYKGMKARALCNINECEDIFVNYGPAYGFSI